MDETGFERFLRRGGRSPSAATRCAARVREFEQFLQATRKGRTLEEADSTDLELFVASTAMEPVTGFIAEFRRELQSTVEWLHPEALQQPPEEEVRRDMEERDLMIDTVEVEDDDEVVVVVEPPGFGGTD